MGMIPLKRFTATLGESRASCWRGRTRGFLVCRPVELWAGLHASTLSLSTVTSQLQFTSFFNAHARSLLSSRVSLPNAPNCLCGFALSLSIEAKEKPSHRIPRYLGSLGWGVWPS
ncbi:hypothetical protein BT69DRAFT_1282140 [Atractiella rhizophila]|nr:hypothetical protein BT69DRAFT_1282140 [Atractiella rhizophila]